MYIVDLLTIDCVTNRREGIVEALKQVDGSSETVVNTLKEYVAMNTTLKSVLQKVDYKNYGSCFFIVFFLCIEYCYCCYRSKCFVKKY